MPNILDILARAQSLMNETALNSITPPRAGGIMYDTLLVLNQMQLEGGSLLISKIYTSVSAMEADTTPTSDLTGRALRAGQLVVIVPTDPSSADLGKVYRYNGPESWSYTSKIGGLPLDTAPAQGSTNGITSGAVYNVKTSLQGEIDQLSLKTNEVYPLVLESSSVDPTEPTKRNYQINTSNKYTSNSSYKHILIPVAAGNIVTVFAASNNTAQMAWLTDDAAPVSGGTPHFVPNTVRFDLNAGETESYTAPNGANFMYFYAGSSPYAFLPQSITIHASKIPTFSVIDNTESSSSKDALSANQGRIMKADINNLSGFVNRQIDLSVLSNVAYAYITSSNKYVSTAGRYGKFLPVSSGQKYRIVAPDTEDAYYSFLTSSSVSSGGNPSFVSGTSRNTVVSASMVDIIIPEGCHYLHFNTLYDSADHTPLSVTQIGGVIEGLERADARLQSGIELNADRLAKGKIGESTPTIALTSGHGINCKDGTAPSSDVLSNTDYIELDGISSIELTVNISTGSNTTRGVAFYDSSKNFIKGIAYPFDSSLEDKSYTVKRYTVPDNAAYFRTCFYTDFAADFKCVLFRADAADNIAVLLSEYLSVGGLDVVTVGSPEIYHHPAIEAGANATTTDQIYSLYDDLVSLYPEWFSRENDIGVASDGVTGIRHYRLRYNFNAAWSLGDYSNNRWDEVYSWRKLLLNAGTHGDEATAIWGVYYFIKALLEGDGNKWAEYIRSNIQIDIIPVLNPYGLDHNQRGNANGVDINRQFDVTSCVEAEALKGVARDILPFAFIDCHTVGTTHGNYLGYIGGPSNGPIHNFLARLVNNLAALFREDWADLAELAGISNKPYIYWCIGQSASTPERAVAWMTFNITKSAVVCEALNVGSTSTKGKPMAKVTVDILANLIPAFMKFN